LLEILLLLLLLLLLNKLLPFNLIKTLRANVHEKVII